MVGEEGDPYGALMVLPVGVDENNGLPGPQGQNPVYDRNDSTRRHERRNNVIGAMTAASVAVEPPRVPREQFVDVSNQITVGARSGLDERYPCRAVRNEHRHEPIALGPYEGRHPVGDVERAGDSTRPYAKGLSVHLR